jgi:hypothetical protein
MLYNGENNNVNYEKIKIVKLHDYYKPYPNFEQFTNLFEIELYYTNYKKLPDLSNCNKLVNLFISYSDIDELPSLPTSLVKIRTLYSNIIKLPDLTNLVNLEELYIENNKNTNIIINDSILKLNNLKKIKLSPISQDDYNKYIHQIVNMKNLSSISINIGDNIIQNNNFLLNDNEDFIFSNQSIF